MAAEKKSFALRVDAATMKAIEKWAADEFRSVNGQIEWILHNALKEAGRLKEKPGSGDKPPPEP
ncbi:MAG: Arc family DNA binding domain-containing protein [Bacteroidetes bacterium]|nr:Arc family DNA binding domain-containing protein [Bacteroidota bacterium]